MDEKRSAAPTIKTYTIEPPVLDQCPNCVNAEIEHFKHLGCDEEEARRTLVITCLRDHWVFAEGPCDSFHAGIPQNAISLPLSGHA